MHYSSTLIANGSLKSQCLYRYTILYCAENSNGRLKERQKVAVLNVG